MLNRRTFIRILAGGAAASMLPLDNLRAFPFPGEDPCTFSVVKGSDSAAAVRKAVELIGGMNSFVSKGDIVFVKPNISWDRPPVQAATTNPAVVETVITMVLEAGAKRVIVADNTCNDARRSYTNSGIKTAAENAGADVPFMEKRKFAKTDLGGEILKMWDVYREVLEADKIINIPIAKHHGLSQVTLSMKNLMGLVGGNRSMMHQKLPESVVDLAAFFRPTLTILDAVRILTANGPQGGTLKDVRRLDTIAASTDLVRIDAFGITLFGDAFPSSDPADFRHIGLAAERGLGSADFAGAGFRKVTLES
ncbi:MAG TPA: DUF362 domain-containing protein [Patescibacteria group bacterium]|nr:DUF362 domain-containing protein [Patescibacteria group bacterium]